MDKLNSVEGFLDELDEMIENAVSLPLTKGRCLIDAEGLREVIDDIRLNIPKEIKQANEILAEQDDILTNAKKEADSVVRFAEEKAKAAVAQHEITKAAQLKANEILAQAQAKSKEMRRATQAFVDDLMTKADNELTKNLTELRQTRQSLRNASRGVARPSDENEED